MRVYKCKDCNAQVAVSWCSSDELCGLSMTEVKPEGAEEKHLPSIEVSGRDVTVSVKHPQSEEHSIKWIALKTKEGEQLKHLSPSSEPVVTFALTESDAPVEAYAFCNLHGFWSAQIN